MTLMIIIFICGVLLYAFYSTWRLLKQSKLNDFNQSSFLFRVLYALYNSTSGQSIHDGMVCLFKNYKYTGPHTKLCTKCDNFCGFSVSYVPFLSDNYAYFIVDRESGETAVVDPADPSLVLKEFEMLRDVHSIDSCIQLRLVMVLCTHKHMDHAGGNSALEKAIPGLQVISGHHEHVASQNVFSQHGDVIKLGSHTLIQIFDTPCHTAGHVVFFVTNISSSEHSAGSLDTHSKAELHRALFTGDTLFSGGVGKFFEGTGTVMEYTLFRTLRPLPPDTRIYCGHEYTVPNLEFGLLVEPNNEAIRVKLQWAKDRRKDGLPTLPTLLADELLCNVYLRADCEDVVRAVNGKGIDKADSCRINTRLAQKHKSRPQTFSSNYRGCEGRGDCDADSCGATETIGVMSEVNTTRVSDVLERLRRWKDTQIRPLP